MAKQRLGRIERRRRLTVASFLSGIALGGVLVPSLASAQEVDAAPSPSAETDTEHAQAGQEILVTARRREESAQDVPTSISVVSQEAIDRANITSVQELQYYVPSLNIQAQGNDFNYPPISLRGQGTYSPGATPAVATYINEVPVPATANAGDLSGGRFYDLQSVQVLKGPQGTLFGRNTTGGAILFVSRRPTNEFEGYVEGTYGSFDQADLKAALNVPVVDDHVLLRFAGQRLSRDGYARVQGTPDHPDGMNMGNRDIWSGRVTLTLKDGAGLSSDFIYETHHQRTNGFPLYLGAINPDGFVELLFPGIGELVGEQQALGRDELLPIGVDPMTKLDFWGITNITEWSVGSGLTLRNIASYGETKFAFQQDVDATVYPILDAPERSLVPGKRRQITEEFQLQGSILDDKLDFILGGFYLDDEQPKFGVTQSTVFGGTGTTSNRIGSSSRALYGQATYELVDGLKATAGYRYTWDQRSFTSRNDETGVVTTLPNVKFSAPSWTLGLDYEAGPDTLIYLASRRGYRSGGYNPGADDPALREFGPEYLTDIEVGVKSDWDLGSMSARTNFAFYYGWYDDIQLTRLILAPSGTEAVTSNAGKANVYGAEFEGYLDVTPALRLSATASWYKEKFTKLLPGVDPAIADYFPKYVPEWQLNLGASYTVPMDPSNGSLRFGANWSYFSETSASLEFIPQPLDTIAPYSTLDISADWERVLGSSIDLSAFVTNVTNELDQTGAIPFYYGVGLTTVTYTLPRAAGIRIKYSF